MRNFFIAGAVCLLLGSCRSTYYIVRHAEKMAPGAEMTADVALTPAGEQRAQALKDSLSGHKIKYVYSTNTLRTRSTAQPTADYFHLPLNLYGPTPDVAFINMLRSRTGGVLVVGHSNTVDNIVNMLCGENKVAGDLQDNEYDNLFIIRKKGKHYTFTRKKYGVPSP